MEISNYTKVVITGEDRSGSAFESLKRSTMSAATGFERLKAVIVGGAFAVLVKNSFEAAERMVDLSRALGIGTDSLQSFRYAADLVGVSQEALETGLQKLSVKIGNAASGNDAAAKSFRDLGIGILDSSNQSRDTGDIYRELATKIGGITDANIRASEAVEFFGKSGKDIVNALGPEFLQLANDADKMGAVIGGDLLINASKAKDQFDSMSRVLGAQLTGAIVQLSPLILSLGNVFAEASKGVAMFYDRFFGAGAEKAAASARLDEINTHMDKLFKNLERLEKRPKNFFSQISDDIQIENAKKAIEKLRPEFISAQKELNDLLNPPALASGGVNKIETHFAEGAGAVEKLHSKLESLLEQDAYVKFAADVEVLNKVLGTTALSQETYNKTFDAWVAKLPEVVKFNKDYIGGLEGISKEELEAAKARFEGVDAFEKQIQAMQDEINLLGPYDRAKRIAIETEKLLKTSVGLTVDEINLEAEAYVNMLEKLTAAKDVIAAQEAQRQEFKKTVDTIESTFHDGFVRMLERGKDSWKSFTQSIINTFKTIVADEIYKVFLKPFTVRIATSVAGSLGGMGTANAAGASGGGFDLSNFSSIGNLVGSNLFGSGVGSISAGGLMTAAPVFEGGSLVAGAEFSSMFSSAGFAAAVPWLAIAAIALPFVASLFDDGPAERTSKFVTGRRGTNPRWSTDTPFGVTGLSEDQWFSGQEMGQALDAFIAGIATTDKQIVDQLNLSTDQITAAKLNLEDLNNKTYSFGTEHEGIEGLAQITQDRYAAIFKAVNEDLSLLVANYSGASDKIGEYITGAVQLYKALDKVGESMPELSKSLLAFASLAGQQLVDTAAIISYAGADPIKDAAELVRLQSRTLAQVWGEQGDALRKLIDTYDGSATATSQLAALTQSRYQTELQLAQQIMQVLDQSHQMFASSAEQIRFSVMSETEKYNSLRNKSLELEGVLASATDPAKIGQLAKQLNDITTQAFGLLGADQQKQQADAFATYLEGLDATVQQKLQDVQATLSGEHNTSLPDSIASAIEMAMEKAAAKFLAAAQAQENAASKQESAAAAQQAAANTPIRVDARVTLAGSEVGR